MRGFSKRLVMASCLKIWQNKKYLSKIWARDYWNDSCLQQLDIIEFLKFGRYIGYPPVKKWETWYSFVKNKQFSSDNNIWRWSENWKNQTIPYNADNGLPVPMTTMSLLDDNCQCIDWLIRAALPAIESKKIWSKLNNEHGSPYCELFWLIVHTRKHIA